jgi:hypothetical protein
MEDADSLCRVKQTGSSQPVQRKLARQIGDAQRKWDGKQSQRGRNAKIEM